MSKQIINPINNQYSSLELPTLQKTGVLKRKGIEKSKYQEIGKYTYLYSNKPQITESSIIESKNINKNKLELQLTPKSINSDALLIHVPKKEKELKIRTEIQKYLRSFTSLEREIAQNKNTLYEFNSKTLNLKLLNSNINKILEYSFFKMSSLISTPNFNITPKNVVINLFFFVVNRKLAKKNFLDLNINKLQDLSSKLSKYFNKPVQLDLTQLYSVSNNSRILTLILGKLGLPRKNSFRRIINLLLKHQSSKFLFRRNQNKYSKFASILTGVYIKLGGRLM